MSKKIDVLFVNGNAAQKIYQDLSKSYSAKEPPIWALLLSKHCKIRGFTTDLLDCEALNLTKEQAIVSIKNINPRLVVFPIYGQQPSASTQNMQGASELAELLKQEYPEYKILFLGGHVSALPLEVLAENFVDFVCQNEGVYTLSSLLDTDLKTDLHTIQGLGWKDTENCPHLNSISAIVKQENLLSDLPGLDWDLYNPKIYRTANWHVNFGQMNPYPFASLYTSLGCIYKCEFCMINIINRQNNANGISAADSAIFRYWEPNHIISEFDKIAELGVKNVKIADEMYVLKPKHFLELSKLLKERDYGFNIWCYSRIDTIKESYLELLKAAGVNWVGLGIESANRKIRKEVTKGRFEDVDIVEIVNLIRKFNINVTGNYIFGLPEETLETMQETLNLALELNTEYANMYCAMAYPGSPLHIQARQNGTALPQTYDGYSQHSYNSFPLSGKYLSNAEILKFRDEAWYKYFLNDNYLNMIESKFGVNSKNHIIELSKIKLKRKLLDD